MLTIQSNLKIQDLETLSKTLIKPDIINFGLNKVGGGYTDKIADKVIAKLSKLGKDKAIVIINDITLQMADKLLEAGYKNIYLAFGSFNKDGTVSNDKTVYNIMKAVIENNIKEKLNAISLEEIFNMKIDGIIANPPYGAIGANIAYTIREKVDYECFVNLLPANDYKRNKTKDLFNYQSDMEAINDGFADAAVTTHLALIHKNKVNNYANEDEFLCTTYLYRVLDKYFTFVADHPIIGYNSGTAPENWTPQNTFIIGQRVIASGKLPKGNDNDAYRWNIEKSITIEQLIKEHNANWYVERNKTRIDLCGLTRTESEIEHINKLVYNNKKFWAFVFTSINTDAGVFPLTRVFPELNYNAINSVEDLLAACNYTKEEIAKVLTELANFNGADD